MARYIDADAFKELITDNIQEDKEAAYWLCVLIDEQPTANVAPIANTVREMQERLKQAICDSTYPDFNKDGKPVTVWKAKTGYDLIDEVVKEMLDER